jgi:hypothetical protein
MATTAPLKMAESGVESRITVKCGAIRGILEAAGTCETWLDRLDEVKREGAPAFKPDFNPKGAPAINALFNASVLVLETWNCWARAGGSDCNIPGLRWGSRDGG